MNKKELRIGNWYIWEAEGKRYPMQVTSSTFDLLVEDMKNFQPMPITESILQHAGFKYRSHDDVANDWSVRCNNNQNGIYSFVWCENYYVVLQMIKENLWNMRIQGPDCNIQGGVRYLHELQNMLIDAGFPDFFKTGSVLNQESEEEKLEKSLKRRLDAMSEMIKHIGLTAYTIKTRW